MKYLKSFFVLTLMATGCASGNKVAVHTAPGHPSRAPAGKRSDVAADLIRRAIPLGDTWGQIETEKCFVRFDGQKLEVDGQSFLIDLKKQSIDLYPNDSAVIDSVVTEGGGSYKTLGWWTFTSKTKRHDRLSVFVLDNMQSYIVVSREYPKQKDPYIKGCYITRTTP